MAFPMMDVNWVAVAIAAVASMIIGSFWYSPAGFGNAWMKLVGFTKKDIKKAKDKGMGKTYLAGFIASVVTSYVLAHFVGAFNLSTFTQGMELGFWLWIGFYATTMLGAVLWEARPWKLYWINSLYWLVTISVMAGILAVWS